MIFQKAKYLALVRETPLMIRIDKACIAATFVTCGSLGWSLNSATAAVRIEGQVQAGGGPLASSTVALWAASAGEPKQLAQIKTDADGRFELRTAETTATDVFLYLVAKGGVATINKGSGDNPA
jgi:hypothetical protein